MSMAWLPRSRTIVNRIGGQPQVVAAEPPHPSPQAIERASHMPGDGLLELQPQIRAG